jgi:hypothetical protein
LHQEGREEQDFFLAALDRGMDTFGANVHMVVYFELKRSFGISRDEIPAKPDQFLKAVEKVFGVGSVAVFRSILKELEASSGIQGLSRKDLLSAMRIAYHEQLERKV